MNQQFPARSLRFRIIQTTRTELHLLSFCLLYEKHLAAKLCIVSGGAQPSLLSLIAG